MTGEDISIIFLIICIGLSAILIIKKISESQQQSNNKEEDIKNNGGRISNKYVEPTDILSYVRKFKPELEDKYKEGYTEKSVENQLAKYLKHRYVTITQQHGVAGKNALMIDIDVADGVMGIELKDAKALLKTDGKHRANGQLRDYIELRYKHGSKLILLVCGKRELETDSILQDVQKICNEFK